MLQVYPWVLKFMKFVFNSSTATFTSSRSPLSDSKVDLTNDDNLVSYLRLNENAMMALPFAIRSSASNSSSAEFFASSAFEGSSSAEVTTAGNCSETHFQRASA